LPKLSTWTLIALMLLCATARAQTKVPPKAVPPQAAAEEDDEDERAEGGAELDQLLEAEQKAGLLTHPAARDQVAAGLGEMHPLAQDLGAALGPSVDGSPRADPAPKGSAFTGLPELAGISEEELRAKYDIPVELNDAVVAYIRFFQVDARVHFEKWLARSTKFMPMMRQILEKEGLPLDLVYLSMIESGFNAYAYSFAKASGLWQFVVGTSRRYGLTSDFWVDERRDPEKATRAAARYLKDLQKRFKGDWFLAWAGYNAGEGKIDRAIRSENTRDFWRMRKKGRTLRSETKHYVPKLIAAALIAKHPERFGFKVQYELPWQVDEVFVPGATDLNVIAKAANITVEEVRQLNPALRRSCTPPGGWTIKLPKGAAPAFAATFDKLLPEQRMARLAEHKIEKGETLSKVARAYGVTEQSILRANALKSFRSIKPGRVLTIPLEQSRGGLVAGAQLEDKAPKNRRAQGRVVVAHKTSKAAKTISKAPRAQAGGYVVRNGDTLWTIAKKFNTTVSKLKELNGLQGRKARGLKAGQAIAVN
jgi:membrane-bound lytic murein transglycosylase D